MRVTIEEVDEPELKGRALPLLLSPHIFLAAHKGDVPLSESGPSVHILPSYSAASNTLHIPEHSYAFIQAGHGDVDPEQNSPADMFSTSSPVPIPLQNDPLFPRHTSFSPAWGLDPQPSEKPLGKTHVRDEDLMHTETSDSSGLHFRDPPEAVRQTSRMESSFASALSGLQTD
ncbi:hypothetical protein MVEN_00878900 [Mycena venus]|uniref:Uncharacterized protein n=1 Tax=Mycena venus TaxID=2733690 RepID=A0A8H6YHB8_9AGAR|nr:hypothetical protein MVEN_00878900 [Mycena venus]